MRNFHFLTHFSSPYFPLENYQDSDSLRIIRITRDFVEIEKRNLYAGKIRVIRVIDYSRSLPSLFFVSWIDPVFGAAAIIYLKVVNVLCHRCRGEISPVFLLSYRRSNAVSYFRQRKGALEFRCVAALIFQCFPSNV